MEVNFVYSKEVVEFITVAKEYNAFAESLSGYKRVDMVGRFQKIMALLYLKASLLPRHEPLSDFPLERFVEEYEWEQVRESLSEKLGELDSFLRVEESLALQGDDPQELSVSECVADIYQDTKDRGFTYNLGNDEASLEALAHCRVNFEQLWGPRCLAAMAEFHKLLYGDELARD